MKVRHHFSAAVREDETFESIGVGCSGDTWRVRAGTVSLGRIGIAQGPVGERSKLRVGVLSTQLDAPLDIQTPISAAFQEGRKQRPTDSESNASQAYANRSYVP